MGSILHNCSLIFVQESVTYHISFLCNQNGIAIKSECHMCKFYLVVSRTGGLLYSMTTLFKDIKAVWPCLTSFAVQVVRKEMIHEAEHAVQPSSGLHASVNSKTASQKTEWVDIRATTVPFVTDILK